MSPWVIQSSQLCRHKAFISSSHFHHFKHLGRKTVLFISSKLKCRSFSCPELLTSVSSHLRYSKWRRNLEHLEIIFRGQRLIYWHWSEGWHKISIWEEMALQKPGWPWQSDVGYRIIILKTQTKNQKEIRNQEKEDPAHPSFSEQVQSWMNHSQCDRGSAVQSHSRMMMLKLARFYNFVPPVLWLVNGQNTELWLAEPGVVLTRWKLAEILQVLCHNGE